MKPDFAAMRAHLEAADALLLIGGRAFVAYPYRDVEPIPRSMKVYHAADNPEAFGREHAADIVLLGDIGKSMHAVAEGLSTKIDSTAAKKQIGERAAAKAAATQALRAEILKDSQSPLTPDLAVLSVLDALPETAMIANDSAATFGRVQDLLVTRPGKYFFARGGVLGCNMPAAVGAALLHEGWVASFVGDGGAMYSPQALWSAAHYKTNVLFFVFNNRRYGVLQNIARQLGCENAVAGRFVGMDIVEPAVDFQSLARSMGVPSVHANTREAIAQEIAAAVARKGPSLIEIAVA